MSNKTTTTVTIPDEDAAIVQAKLVEDGPDRPGCGSLAAAIAWIVRQWVRDRAEPRVVQPPVQRGGHGGVGAISDEPGGPVSPEPTEGARLKAARVAAGLTQGGLADALNLGGSVIVGRDQVQRAERAASLEPWPALRAWLLERKDHPAP